MTSEIPNIQKLRAIIDIQKREIADLKVQLRIAQRDELTGLPRRSELIEGVQHSLNNKQLPVSIVIASIIGFKNINEAIWHVAGDSLISQFAEYLKRQKSHLEENGSLITLSRLGRSEFAILLPCTSHKEAGHFVTIIKANLQNEIFAIGEDHSFHIHVAMGVATADFDCPIVSTLMHRADVAMHEDMTRIKEASETMKKTE